MRKFGRQNLQNQRWILGSPSSADYNNIHNNRLSGKTKGLLVAGANTRALNNQTGLTISVASAATITLIQTQ